MNRIERAAILCGRTGSMGLDLFQGSSASQAETTGSLSFSGETDPERWLLAEGRWRAEQILRLTGGDRRRTARLLGVTGQRLSWRSCLRTSWSTRIHVCFEVGLLVR